MDDAAASHDPEFSDDGEEEYEGEEECEGEGEAAPGEGEHTVSWLEAQPEPEAYQPAGGPEGVHAASDGVNRDLTRNQLVLGGVADAPREDSLPLPPRLVFCLLSVDAAEPRRVRSAGPFARPQPWWHHPVPAEDVPAVAAATPAELASYLDRAAAAAPPPPPGVVPPTRMYVTGILPDGRKLGLVASFHPTCEVEMLGGARNAEWFRRAVVPALEASLKVARGTAVVHVHHAAHFMGFQPDPKQDPPPGPSAPPRRLYHETVRLGLPTLALLHAAADRLRMTRGFDGAPLEEARRLRDAGGSAVPNLHVYEDGQDTRLKFMQQWGLLEGGWHELVAPVGWGAWVRRPSRELLVDVELEWVEGATLRAVPPDGEPAAAEDPHPASAPPTLLACLDAEMNSGTPNRMPRAYMREHAVVVVSAVFAWSCAVPPALAAARPELAPGAAFERRAWVLGRHCAPLPGVLVELFDTEAALLAAVRRCLFVEKKVDVVAGHNILGFDVVYLAERAWMGGAGGEGAAFRRFSAHLTADAELYRQDPDNSRSTPAYLVGPGFAYLDSMDLCRKQHKLRSNKLAFAAATFLGPGAAKLDMPYTLIPAVCASGRPAAWAKFVNYCVMDSVLVLRLLGAWDSVRMLWVQARVMRVTLPRLTLCGQQERIEGFLTAVAKLPRFRMVMNGVRTRGKPKPSAADHKRAQGGWVMDNVPGCHDMVAVLDFASLYPTIMSVFNLCYSTVYHGPWPPPPGVQVQEHRLRTRTTRFVTGVDAPVPFFLADLKAQRKKWKGVMDSYPKGHAMHSIANFAQNAIKTMMNAVYGMANCWNGRAPCEDLGTTTCGLGRTFNEAACALVTREFSARILYGDTDSIFIQFPQTEEEGGGAGAESTRVARLRRDMATALRAADAVTAQLRRDLKSSVPTMEFEKIFGRAVLVTPKKYSGMAFTPADLDKPLAPNLDRANGAYAGYLMSKGGSLTKRDDALFAAGLLRDMLEQLLVANNPDAAYDRLHTCVEALVGGTMPVPQLVITKELRPASERATQLQPQQAVSWELEWQRPGSGFQDGDRVPVVMVVRPNARQLVPPPHLAEDAAGRPWTDASIAPARQLALETAAAKLAARPDVVAARARHPEHLGPMDVIDVMFYVRVAARCAAQVFPTDKALENQLLAYARAHVAARASDAAAASSASLVAHLGLAANSNVKKLAAVALSHRAPVPPAATRRSVQLDLMGRPVVPVVAKRQSAADKREEREAKASKSAKAPVMRSLAPKH